MSIHLKINKVLDEPTLPNIRPMVKKDVSKVKKVLKTHLDKMQIAFEFSKEEIEHYFLPREGVMYTYVIESEDKKLIQDIFSFYSLPSTILKPNKHSKINACFSYYNTSLVHSPELVMENAIILAKKNGFDVLNCLDILENEKTIEKNNF